jgi:hypothetical protein
MAAITRPLHSTAQANDPRKTRKWTNASQPVDNYDNGPLRDINRADAARTGAAAIGQQIVKRAVDAAQSPLEPLWKEPFWKLSSRSRWHIELACRRLAR